MTVYESILAAFPDGDSQLRAKDLIEMTGENKNSVYGALSEMADDGRLAKVGHGLYALGTGSPGTPGRVVPIGRARDPIYSAYAGAGEGGAADDAEIIGYVEGAEALSGPNRSVGRFFLRGDSMEPNYRKGCLVPVFMFPCPPRDVTEDDVYLFRLENALQVKRLQRLPGGRIRIISDNPAYGAEIVEVNDGVDFEIIGRVLA